MFSFTLFAWTEVRVARVCLPNTAVCPTVLIGGAGAAGPGDPAGITGISLLSLIASTAISSCFICTLLLDDPWQQR